MSEKDILKLEQLKDSFGDDPETFIAVLEMFMIEVPNDYDDLKSKMTIGDYYASGLLAHKVKSSYRMLGMEKETLLLQEIEDRAKRKEHLEEIPALYQKFKDGYEEGLKLIVRTIKHLKGQV